MQYLPPAGYAAAGLVGVAWQAATWSTGPNHVAGLLTGGLALLAAMAHAGVTVSGTVPDAHRGLNLGVAFTAAGLGVYLLVEAATAPPPPAAGSTSTRTTTLRRGRTMAFGADEVAFDFGDGRKTSAGLGAPDASGAGGAGGVGGAGDGGGRRRIGLVVIGALLLALYPTVTLSILRHRS